MYILGKILKLENQPIETFQGISFVQSIILAHDNVKNELYNNYINLVCNDSNNINNIIISFPDVTWEDFRLRDIVYMDIYKISNIKRNNFASFLKERIDHNDYILIFNIDEFYLTYSKAYRKIHNIHDTYIFGYDDHEFMVMAYKKNKLQRIRVNQNEIISGIYKIWSKDKDIGICTLHVNKLANIDIDLNNIIICMKNYLESKDNSGEVINDNNIYGLNIYKLLEKYLTEKKVGANVDLRIFRILLEHKKIMRLRIKALIDIYNVNTEFHNEIVEIEHMAESLFNMIIKYLKSYNTNIMERAVLVLKKIEYKERLLLRILITNLDEIYKNSTENERFKK